jgi:hypothetical protein
MSTTGVGRVIYETLILVALFGSVGFIVHYSLVYSWWRDEVGRHIVAFSGCVGAFLLFFTVSFFFPAWPGRDWVRFALFLFLVGVIWWRWIVFIRVRRQDRRATRENQR